MLRPIALTTTLLLIGCGTASSEFVRSCPALVHYTPADERAAAIEMAALPPASTLRRFIDDYASLRDQVRACQR